MVANGTDRFMGMTLLVLVLVSVAGSFIERGKQQKLGAVQAESRASAPASHEAAHGAARAAEAFPGAMRLLEPYVAPVEAKPLEEAPEPEGEGDVSSRSLSQEDRRIVSALGDLEALIQSLETGRRTLNARELNGYLANCIGSVREAGGTLEELDLLLEKFFVAVQMRQFREDEIGWLRTESDLQRDRFAGAKP